MMVVYLSDVVGFAHQDLVKSRWFKHGWTLQELLTPGVVWCYDKTCQPPCVRGPEYTHKLVLQWLDLLGRVSGTSVLALQAGVRTGHEKSAGKVALGIVYIGRPRRCRTSGTVLLASRCSPSMERARRCLELAFGAQDPSDHSSGYGQGDTFLDHGIQLGWADCIICYRVCTFNTPAWLPLADHIHRILQHKF